LRLLTDAAHDLGIDRRYAVTDRRIQLDQREEAAMAQLRQHEALDDLDRDLDLRLIARLHHTGGEHNAAVVVGEVLVRPVDAGLVARWLRDAGLKVVGHERLRDAADRRKCVHMRADPIGQRLSPACLGVGVIGRAKRRDEDVRAMLLASCRIKNRHGVAGPVDKQLLASKMRLAHRRRDALPPVAVPLAEPAVGVALGVLSAVLLPEQRQRYPAPLQLRMVVRPVRLSARRGRRRIR